jgi:type I restriction enzyme S subunit
MSKAWPLVPLGEIAKAISRVVSVQPGEEYRTIGVKWWGEGAYERETIDGSRTAAKTLSIVRADDLIINKIWVRHGSTAIASPAVDGCAASGEFPTFELNRDRVEPRWIHWQTKTKSFWDKCDSLSRGTSGKNRIKPELFLTIGIPLPPIVEQRKLLATIEHLAAKIEEADKLSAAVVTELDCLARSLLLADPDRCSPTPMRDIVRQRPLDVAVQGHLQYQFAGVYCFGRGVFRSKNLSGSEFAYKQLTTLRTGDFVYPKLMAWEGALATVPPHCDGCVVSPEFPVFDLDRARVLPETLDVFFRMPNVWPRLSGSSTGTNVRRKRLNPRDFLSFLIPLPSMVDQERLAAVKAQADVIKQRQAAVVAELIALRCAVLYSYFMGDT